MDVIYTDYIYHGKIRGSGLLQLEEAVEEEKRSLNDYISRSREKLLKAMKMENILKTTETKAQYKKQQFVVVFLFISRVKGNNSRSQITQDIKLYIITYYLYLNI